MHVTGTTDGHGEARVLTAILSRAMQSPAIVLVGILALTVVVHIPGLTVWFQSDDFRYLAAVRHASAPTFVRQAFDFRDTSAPAPGFLGHYRPLYLIGWLVRYRLFGLDAVAYQVLSLALHLAVVILTWWIARRLSGRVLTAHLAALVMALHPAFTRSVIWLAATGSDIEVTLGILVTLAVFLAYVDGGRRQRLVYAASVGFYAVALCLHPKAIPLVIVLAGVCCLRSERGLRELLRPTTLALLAPFAVMAVAYAAIQQHVQRSNDFLQVLYGFGWNNPKDFLGYAAVAAAPLWRDVWYRGFFFYASNTYRVLLFGAIVTADVAIGLVLLVRTRHRDAGIALLATLWFVSMVAPLTSFKLGIVDRDLYVAGPAWALLVGLAGTWIADATRSRPALLRPLAGAALVAAIVLASGWTIRYERDFRSEERNLETLVGQLQETYPALAPGTQLYLVPESLDILRSAPLLPYIITTYYPGVEGTLITPEDAASREPSLSRTERIFRFRG